MISVDTNIIVRFLTHDDDKQYKKAFKIFNSNEIFIADTVILETEWVLRYAYKFSSENICNAFINLFCRCARAYIEICNRLSSYVMTFILRLA